MTVVWVLLAIGLVGLLVLGVTVAGHLRRLTRERAAVGRDLAARTASLRALVNPSRRRDEHRASP